MRTHKIAFPNCHFGLMLYIACCTKRMQLILVHFHYFSDIVTIALHKHLSLSQRKNQTIIYGGKRARKLVKSREMFHNSNIDVVQLRAANHVGQQILNWRLQRSHNPWNCAYINPLPVVKLKREAEKAFVPSGFLSNVMSMEPKIDESPALYLSCKPIPCLHDWDMASGSHSQHVFSTCLLLPNSHTLRQVFTHVKVCIMQERCVFARYRCVFSPESLANKLHTLRCAFLHLYNNWVGFHCSL